MKRRRTEAGGPRSPSATPPLPPDMEEPRPQLPTEPPPTQPEAPLPTEGSFMPSLKDTKPREPVAGKQKDIVGIIVIHVVHFSQLLLHLPQFRHHHNLTLANHCNSS